jgi:UDP-2,4-diacetamido-2,4,6-trideoxy-beta-L-altropyranose hydrolase
MDKKLLMLTEAGKDIGFGHYFRCQALKEYFQENGVEVQMLLDLKGNYDFEEEKINWLEKKEVVSGYVKKFPFVFIDSYLAPESYYQFLSGTFAKTIVMDDYNRIPYKADMIINPNVYGDEINYSTHAKVLSGKDFILLRKPFRECRQKYAAGQEVKKVLLTLGGSDVRNLIPSLIEWLASKNAEVTVIAGNEEYKKELESRYIKITKEIAGFADAGQMLKYMLNADLVVSACGQTLHELAYLGVPSIGVCVGDDQISNMKKYGALGYLQKEIYWNDSDLKDKIFSSYDLLSSSKKRSEVSLIGMSHIKGEGVKNIFNHVFYV